MTPNADESARYRVKSLDRAIDVLEALAEAGSDGVPLADLSRRLGASKSTTFAILQTLLARRFVADTGGQGTRRYRLGMELARLGGIAVADLELPDLAMPVMRELTAATGATSRLAVLDETNAVVVSRIDARDSVRFDLRMGKRELLHSTGVGKALLSALPAEHAREIVDRAGMPARTRHTITDPKRLLTDLAAAAESGYAIDDEEDADGIFCVGSPIFNHGGGCAGALSITALKLDLPSWRMHELGAIVRDHAERITAALAGPPRAQRMGRPALPAAASEGTPASTDDSASR